MADFQVAFEKILETQGMHPYYNEVNELEGDHLLCSECFKDVGLKLTAETIGIKNEKKCPNCGSVLGFKITEELVRKLGYLFFVRGTIERFEYGGFPLIQMNQLRPSNINVSNWLEDDLKLLESFGHIGLFYYHPRFWMLGEIEPLKSLQLADEVDQIIDRILQTYPTHLITQDHPFYRVRINPDNPNDPLQYDSPPDSIATQNRFSDSGVPILYGSPDIELCIHECRATVEDKLFFAQITPTRSLKLINFAALIVEDVSEFESLDLAIHFLFLAGNHAYSICGQIAKRISDAGFDGIIYPSYFSYIRTGNIPFDTILGMSIRKISDLYDYAGAQSLPNVALFGRPVIEGKVTVSSINRIMLNSIKYDMSFGPSSHGSEITTMPVADYLEKRMNDHINAVLESIQNRKAE